ncbi:MAG: electron transfer flavoprotein subunit alpha/FixB family protein, partial [Deltaproteobacteria bacterium]|nr:electron transfer flavoprotein subunit alpha/FixB family protein [Deltaproteobacteria bacterium]
VIGHSGGAELGGFGADAVLAVSGGDFGRYSNAAFVSAVQAAIAAVQPAAVFASAGAQARDGLPRVAARLGLGVGADVTELRVEGGALIGRRPVYSGKAFADVVVSSSPAIFTLRANAFGVPASTGAQAPVSALAVSVSGALTQVVDREAPTSSVVDLTEADRIVSGGRSVQSKDGYDKLVRPLAAVIGATPGASRACVDAGYAPHSHQVGQTGKVVNPSLYIALGISGQIQHLAGMRTSKIIVAVNKDATAPIFQHATYGIVADMFEVGPALQAELKAALAQ